MLFSWRMKNDSVRCIIFSWIKFHFKVKTIDGLVWFSPWGENRKNPAASGQLTQDPWAAPQEGMRAAVACGSWPVSALTLCRAASHAHTAARRDCLVETWALWYPDSAQPKQTAQCLWHIWGKRQLQLEGRRKENLQLWIIAWLFRSRRHSHSHLPWFKAAVAQRHPGRTPSHGQRFSARPLTPSRVLYPH